MTVANKSCDCHMDTSFQCGYVMFVIGCYALEILGLVCNNADCSGTL